MDLPTSFYIASIIAILITGISKSGFGGGLGVMAVPIMSLFVAPQFAAAVMMPILLAMDVLIVWRYRWSWSRPIVWSLLPSALVGLGLGALVFQHMQADVVRFLIGVLALFFVAQFLMQRRKATSSKATPTAIVWFLGALSGFASFVAHAGGPPVKGYLLSQNLDKTVFVGTNTVFFFSLNSIKTLAYGSAGMLNPQSLTVSLLIAPCLFLGVFIGTRLHHVVDQAVFVKIVYGFLTLAGAKLLWDSVPTFV